MSKPTKRVVWSGCKELRKARQALGLNKSQMVDVLRANGLRGVNWGTYHSWETGAVVPRGPYEEMLFRIIGKALVAAGKPPIK